MQVCNRTKFVPEVFEVEGVVQAELWQRPAEICLMFFPCRAVISVASFTGLQCPRPSCSQPGNEGSNRLVVAFYWVACVTLYQRVSAHLSLAVAAPGVDVSSGGQSEHVLTANGDIFYEQTLQRWDHLGVGPVLQHRVRKANQTL